MNPLLYGYNADERIVAVQQKDDSTMRIYFRDSGGVRHEDESFFPFLFLGDRHYIDGFPRKHWIKKLEGDAFLGYVCAFEEWSSMWDAVRFMVDLYNRDALKKIESYADLEFLRVYSDPVAQYLMQTGRTLFKGMTFESLHRLQLDIETYTAGRYGFSNAGRPQDRIILIALSDNKGWQHLIDGRKMTEPQMLNELTRIINEKDPDVIEGHNIFNFDIPYILKRCDLHNVSLAIGRDGSTPRTFDSRTSFAERSFEYTVADIAGRHIIDTLLLVQGYDMTKREMESYGLKYAARYFGLTSPDRTYIQGSKISWHWDNDPESLMAYALDDVDETRKLSEQLSGTSFYLTQMLPFNYGHVARMGSAAKIESLMVREYLRLKHSIPKPTKGTQTTGGYTDIFVTGILGPIVHVDVESLYPSIMINLKISPATDECGAFMTLLRELTTLRLDTKKAMQRSSNADEKTRFDARQSSLKILINSFYGYLGYGRGLFNDYAKADAVTKAGQALLRKMISHIQAEGGKVVEVDTDGIFFVPPEAMQSEEVEHKFLERLSRALPEGISVALDGRYKKMLSYKMKNYALLGYDRTIKVKGSSLTSRSMERFGRNYILQCIDCLLNNNLVSLHNLYTGVYHSIMEHKLDVKDFARVETLKEPLSEYSRQVEAGTRNRSAAYEVALSAGKPFRPGNKVAYYITGNDANPRGFDNCKSADEWDQNFPDENTAFYLRRLDEFSEKFKPLFTPQDFRAVFSADDLFPFDPTGIALLIIDAEQTETETKNPNAPSEFDIWLEG